MGKFNNLATSDINNFLLTPVNNKKLRGVLKAFLETEINHSGE